MGYKRIMLNKMLSVNNVNKNDRIARVFEELKWKNKKALIPFITAGYPDYESYLELFYFLERNGADIIEIGIPFSDPLADGPVIQKTSKAALESGINTDTVLNSVKEIRLKSSIPIVILAYFNTLYKYGLGKFLKKAENYGVDGLIIPDLPLEEFYNYKDVFNKSRIANIMLATLTSTRERLEKIADICSGFLYCVTVKGVTGARDDIDDQTRDFLINLRSITELPLAIGFGISNINQINKIKKYCDAVIIGSKILSILMESKTLKIGLEKLKYFLAEINRVLKED
ncbi:MAG: tryptophan synthase subunit alpha [Actinobacteria bacterium]|nr:tryptophan synthase subunit alpha [Actinomycetota bacterium]